MPQAFLNALLGGALIGLSASVLLVVDGRVAGISGILGGVLQPRRGETGWRVAFLTGLLAGAGALAVFYRRALSAQPPALPTVWLVVAGLLVGVGTQLASGCTSGHGVCGLSRLSKRSVAAVMSFMIAAAVTTYFIRHVLAVSS